jgi:hypothetical protein
MLSLHRAGLEPVRSTYAHALAYLAEALAPVWGLDAVDGEVLKKDDLPFFPELQRSIDELIWLGLLEVTEFDYAVDSRGRWKSNATCKLVTVVSHAAIEAIELFPEEVSRNDLYLEIALGMARNEPIEALFLSDASYSDPRISVNRVIELGSADNPSSSIAERFGELTANRTQMLAGQKIGLYLNHLGRVTRG